MSLIGGRFWKSLCFVLGLAASALTMIPLLAGMARAQANAKPDPSLQAIRPITIQARRLASFQRDSEGRAERVGRLEFRGGLVLTSPDRDFGGLSGIEISPDGRTVVLVSDAGSWLRAGLVYSKDRLSGIGPAVIGPLKAMRDRALARQRDRDAEAVRLFRGNFANGTLLIGFEANQRIGFFDIRDGVIRPPSRYLRPPMRISSSKGIESVTRLRGGRHNGAVVMFAERSLDPNGHHRGWMWQGSKPVPLALTNVGGFDITDVAGLPDGSLVVLERRFRWTEGIKMRIRLIPMEDIGAGKPLQGETLMSGDLSANIDNMEGISVHQNSEGQTILTVVSDNNFNTFLQRNLLLQFAMVR